MLDDEKIHLSGFNLEPVESEIIKNIIKTYKHKIEEKTSYQEIRLRLKKSRHGKAFMHEVNGNIMAGKLRITASSSNYNMYKALTEVLEKLLNETEHRIRKR